MGRTARGVRGIRMPQGVKCISLSVLKDTNNSLLLLLRKVLEKEQKLGNLQPMQEVRKE